MRKSLIIALFAAMAILSAIVAHAQIPAPSGVPVAPVPPQAAGGVMVWLHANWALVVAPLIVALFDLGFAINPSWKSNGIAHWVYLACGGKEV